jgi:hypothetical protein
MPAAPRSDITVLQLSLLPSTVKLCAYFKLVWSSAVLVHTTVVCYHLALSQHITCDKSESGHGWKLNLELLSYVCLAKENPTESQARTRSKSES